MIDNPFPGPRPYRRASDRTRFFGREALAHKIECMILGHRAVTLYGPSAAGKTSLMKTGVLPKLIETDDIRVVAVDSWPEGKDAVEWLAFKMRTALQQDEAPRGTSPLDKVLLCAKGAARSSPRLLVLHLDQIEHALYTSRDPEVADALFDCLHQLAELPLRGVRVVLCLREDYLGRLRDRLQDRRRLLEHMIRVGPLTAGEMTSVACRAAALGAPQLTWSAERMGPMMRAVRAPGQPDADDAEVQLAYAQIICRSLFQREAAGGAAEGGGAEAEDILRGYLDESLAGLGQLTEPAQKLLEDHLITAEGGRTLRAEHELLRLVKHADPSAVLLALEMVAVVQAREHDGARYLEIGHDWFARRVLELRETRPRPAEQERSSAPGGRAPSTPAPEPGPAAMDRRDIAIEELRRQRRMLVVVLAVLSTIVAVASALSVWAWQSRCSGHAVAADGGDCR